MLGKIMAYVIIAVVLCAGIALMLTGIEHDHTPKTKTVATLEQNVASIAFWVKFWSALTLAGIAIKLALVAYALLSI